MYEFNVELEFERRRVSYNESSGVDFIYEIVYVTMYSEPVAFWHPRVGFLSPDGFGTEVPNFTKSIPCQMLDEIATVCAQEWARAATLYEDGGEDVTD